MLGMVLTVLIALEFKHTLLVVKHHRHAIVEVRAVVLIALLALVRRFIILDLYQTPPPVLAAWPDPLWPWGWCFGWSATTHPRRRMCRSNSRHTQAADGAKNKRNLMIPFHQSRLQRRERL
jgi:Phosphate-starvation-inducible E family